MASRIMHYAITKCIAEKVKIKDINRLCIGSILPDAYNPNGPSTKKSHYKIVICDGTRKTYDLTKYRNQFGCKMKVDDLYLGYYLHLIQDIIYRQFVYDDYKWNPAPEGNVEKLHNDYHLINTYVIQKYGLKNDIYFEKDFSEEEIFAIYPFGIEQLLSDLENDFVPYCEGEIFFFTEKMADEFIQRAADVCVKEIEALRTGGELLDENRYAWMSH